MHGKTIAGLRKNFLKISQMTSFEERDKAIKQLMEEYEDFFIEYYSNYFDGHVGLDDVTSENNGVAKTLEVLGSFLIYAENEDNPCDKSYFDSQLLN